MDRMELAHESITHLHGSNKLARFLRTYHNPVRMDVTHRTRNFSRVGFYTIINGFHHTGIRREFNIKLLPKFLFFKK